MNSIHSKINYCCHFVSSVMRKHRFWMTDANLLGRASLPHLLPREGEKLQKVSWPGKGCAGWNWDCHLLWDVPWMCLLSKPIPASQSISQLHLPRLILFSGVWWWGWKLGTAKCLSSGDCAVYLSLLVVIFSGQSGCKMPPDQSSNDFHLLCAAINEYPGKLGWKAACCCRGDRHSCYFCFVVVHRQKLCWVPD